MLYTYLSASKDDTNDELRTKYKKLCRTIHPDKADANNKEVSLNVFREVESAYEILSDPLKKLIYDNYGLDGLDYYQNFGEHFELAY
jgi:curved DNA-binding protein CbpA